MMVSLNAKHSQEQAKNDYEDTNAEEYQSKKRNISRSPSFSNNYEFSFDPASNERN